MTVKSEIELLLIEEERKARRNAPKLRMQQRSRMIHPTYFAVFATKIIIFLRRFRFLQRFKLFQRPDVPTGFLSRQPPPKPQPVDQPKKRPVKSNVTFMSIVAGDIKSVKKKLFPVKEKPLPPGGNESWKDWEDQI